MTQTFEADPRTAAWVIKTVQDIKFMSRGNAQAAIALASTLCANTHLVLGGNLDKIDKVGDLFKLSVEASLYAVKDHKHVRDGKGLII